MPIDEGLDLLFSLKTSIKPEDITDSEWSVMAELPFLRENDGCKIAFLAVRFINGSISYDTSTWEAIRSEVQRLKRSCAGAFNPPSGGHLIVGDHSRLAVILYAPGSVYDDKVKADVAEGIIVVANQDPEAEVGASAGVVGGSSLVCSGALPVLKNSTDCSTVAGTVNVS